MLTQWTESPRTSALFALSLVSNRAVLHHQSLGLVCLVVRDYAEALEFFLGTLGFELVEDSYVPAQDKRWVVIRPPGANGARLLLARASDEEQATRIGNQTGGRVFLFLYTDDFWRDYNTYRSRGVEFVRGPSEADYGIVAVFLDLYGKDPTACNTAGFRLHNGRINT